MQSMLGFVDLLAIWNGVWPYLMMLAGFSLIVFVHELGHFAVAKWAGIRVERFAIGFGREIFGFTRGETRYSFNFLPLGGYVKMLGQEDFDDKAEELKFKDDPQSFVNKPVGHRMAVVSAGVIMNVLFACFLFMIVFMVGMETTGSRIGYVDSDSPAEKAGLLPGDEVVEINGETILEFNEITTAVFLSEPHRRLEFVVQRGDERKRLLIEPEKRLFDRTSGVGRQVIGIRPGRTREIVAIGPGIDEDLPDSPKVGDKIVELAGMEVTDDNISGLLDVLAYTRDPIVVERVDPDDPEAPAQRVEVRISPQLLIDPPTSTDPESVSVLGLAPLVKFGMVDPDGRAFLAGIENDDIVLVWDDTSFPSSSDIASSIRDSAERDITYQVLKPDGRVRKGVVQPKLNKNGPATIQARCKPIGDVGEGGDESIAQFSSVRTGGLAQLAGIESGDSIVGINDIENPSATVVNRLIREGKGSALVVTVRKSSGALHRTTVYPIAPGSIDAGFGLMADEVLQVGRIVDEIGGRPSSAARAGIPAGATIIAAAGKPVTRWRQLIDVFQASAGTDVDLVYRDLTGERHLVAFPVPHSIRTVLGVGPEARILSIDGNDSVTTMTNRGEEDVTVRHHEGTRAALDRLVGQKEIPIEFRANSHSPTEVKYIDVTAEMVDPWLGRVAFIPNAAFAEQTIMLKGKNWIDAIGIGIHKTYYFVAQVYQVMHRMIFSRSVSMEAMSGPLGIINLGGQIAQSSTVKFLFFLAMISANLAVINFLPLPIVDGGLMVFLLIEKIKGSPVSLRVQVATQMIGIFLIVSLFLLVTYNDAVRLWG